MAHSVRTQELQVAADLCEEYGFEYAATALRSAADWLGRTGYAASTCYSPYAPPLVATDAGVRMMLDDRLNDAIARSSTFLGAEPNLMGE